MTEFKAFQSKPFSMSSKYLCDQPQSTSLIEGAYRGIGVGEKYLGWEYCVFRLALFFTHYLLGKCRNSNQRFLVELCSEFSYRWILCCFCTVTSCTYTTLG